MYVLCRNKKIADIFRCRVSGYIKHKIDESLKCCFYLVLCDGFNDKYFISIIAHSGDYKDVHALIDPGLHHII